MPRNAVIFAAIILLSLSVGVSARAHPGLIDFSAPLAARETPTPGPTNTPKVRFTPTPVGSPTATWTPGAPPTATSTMEPANTPTDLPTSTPIGPTATPISSPDYDYYLTGDPQNVSVATNGGLMLQGGGGDVDKAFEWLIDQSGGGDFVIIRASGADGYNAYVDSIGGVDSIETLVIKSAAAANDVFVLNVVENADVLFIAGGDQWKYVEYWKGTLLEDAIHSLRDQNVPIGGSSAGLAILGQFLFSAENGTVYADEALADPYNMYMTLEQDFLSFSPLAGVITDSHFKERDRMGRLVGFLARIVQDGWAAEARGIGVNEQTALVVDTDGSATVLGAGGVYFLQTPGAPEVCQPRSKLQFLDISVTRIFSGASFNLYSWTGSGGTTYSVSASNGSLSSTLGREVY